MRTAWPSKREEENPCWQCDGWGIYVLDRCCDMCREERECEECDGTGRDDDPQ